MVKRRRVLLDHEREIKENLGLVRFLAGLAFDKVKHLGCVEFEDFLQVGMLGALEGLRKFDVRKGKKGPYLYFRVKGKLNNLLKKIYRRRKVLQTSELGEESAVVSVVEDFGIWESLLKLRKVLEGYEARVFDCLVEYPLGLRKLVARFEGGCRSKRGTLDVTELFRKSLSAYVGISNKRLGKVIRSIRKKFEKLC